LKKTFFSFFRDISRYKMSRRRQKKRWKNRRRRDSSEEESDNSASEESSVISFDQDIDPGFISKHMGDMEGCLEPLTEKRSMIGGADRSRAYVLMTNLLLNGVWHDWCLTNVNVLRQIYIDSLKRGDRSERIKALQCCFCVIITLGDNLPSSFSTALTDSILLLVRSNIPFLRFDFEGTKAWGASSSGEAGQEDFNPDEEKEIGRMVRLCMNILPLIEFSRSEQKAIRKIETYLYDIWTDSGYQAPVRTGALEGWVMAVCTLKAREKGGLLFKQAMPSLVEIIEQDPSAEMAELFTLAGYSIALLYEANFALQFQDETESEGVDHENDHDEDSFNYDNADNVDTEYIKSLLEGMSTQSSKGHNKDTIRTQRRNFREFARALEENSPSPSVDLKLKTEEFKLVGWTSTILWEYMKRNLAGGLQVHLLANSWLQNIFEIDGSSLEQSIAPTKYEKEDILAVRKFMRKEQYLKIKKARGLKYRVQNDAFVY